MLKIALPKGRIAKETLNAFSQIFGGSFEFEDRKLKLVKDDFEFLMVRSQDIDTYVMGGAADLGVVGLDVLEEHGSDVLRLLDLDLGHCKVCVGTIGGEQIDYNKTSELRVATSLDNITQKYFSAKAVPVKIIHLYGSVELAPLVNLADCIVDIVETGDTMRQNGLAPCEEIMKSSAYLIANKLSFVSKKAEILEIYSKLEALIKARN